MIAWLKLRLAAELRDMRLCWAFSLFFCLSFCVSGFITASRLTVTAGEATASFMLGGNVRVFSVFFSLMWKRAAALALQAIFSLYVAGLPAALLCQLFLQTTFALAWGPMFTGFWRTAALAPFLAIPAVLFLFVSVRSLSWCFKNTARQIRERRIPRTAAEIALSGRDMLLASLQCAALITLGGAAEAIIAVVAL